MFDGSAAPAYAAQSIVPATATLRNGRIGASKGVALAALSAVANDEK
jgi:hypothetical protein